MLSQEEINQLLQGQLSNDNEPPAEESENSLGSIERDALGEVGNICMGTAATTLFALLNQKVSITTPMVAEETLNELKDRFVEPYVLIFIGYKIGLTGTNLLIINEKDVKIITDLMMGGDGTAIDGDLSELHLSAISEAMNQMIGSSATSMSEMLGTKVDIEPPKAVLEKIETMTKEEMGFDPSEKMVVVSFRMTVGNLIDSEIMQIMPHDMASKLAGSLINPSSSLSEDEKRTDNAASSAKDAPVSHSKPPVREAPRPAPQAQPQYAEQAVNAKRVEFSSFEIDEHNDRIMNEINLIRDVSLEISVELGSTSKRIHDILEFAVGTVVELDRLVGEPLDILANGKKIAKGEVVVVDENYGVRITEIVLPEHRLI